MANFDPYTHRAGYLPATAYTLPHLSRFTVAHEPESHMLRHVSCGLLSTPGVPPTLLALKQHAQSLAYLIAMLEPHGSDDDAVEVLLGRVDSVKKTRERDDKDEEDDSKKGGKSNKSPLKSPVVDLFGFQGLGLRRKKKVRFADTVQVEDSAPSLLRLVAASRDKPDYKTAASPFDWLDFRRPYTNDEDPDHHRPLLDLVNEVHTRDVMRGTTYHCPLKTFKLRNTPSAEDDQAGDKTEMENRNETVRLYASHHNLLMHANTCLERLDHEYAATGGLLSLLPTTGTDTDTADQQAESPQLSAARNTLVGQWLIFTQQLVGRLHELEISYANAVHALAGKTVLAPYLGQGDMGGQGDKNNAGSRWILANAGDDVWSLIHDKLDAAAAAASDGITQRHTEGVVGERAVTPSANSLPGLGFGANTNITPLPENHLVHVDVTTRFYRTGVVNATPDKASRGPIFISPAKPNISVHAPVIGEGLPDVADSKYSVLSASALEQRYDDQLREAARVARDNTQLTQRLIQRTKVLLLLRHDHARLQKINAALQEAVGKAQGNAGTEASPSRGVKRARRS
ncbi:hypothetical protein F503_01680 [Ophiostoma piceae UAMH 11346]|uniref:Uncharacterized protein n=1 Tax=Ophiostoma piceae (strain UAMH 11346) TaxID=1262450 RepID=S3BPF6_OPHP1|nr:hypothetical protein F503_01680 [Ophiostoma piceae UAMH 11346]